MALTAGLLSPGLVSAEGQVKEWNSYDSLGCMMMRECIEGTTRLVDTEHIEQLVVGVDYNDVRDEADGIIAELDKMGVGVYLADEKYFPRGHAGVYYTVGNDFFLNEKYASDPQQMLETLRHEAWHAAQDAMACTINNSNIAIILPMESVPQQYVLLAEIAYPPAARPWEQEAKWAGATPNMTLDVLKTINETGGRPWEVISPTPLTMEWLEVRGCF
jgi:hypothetical protein